MTVPPHLGIACVINGGLSDMGCKFNEIYGLKVNNHRRSKYPIFDNGIEDLNSP